MRLLALVAIAAGTFGAVFALAAAFRSRRPADLAWAMAAPLAIVVALVGLVTLVSPRFLP